MRLKESLMTEILQMSNNQSTKKYTKSMLNLKTLIDLEKMSKFKLNGDNLKEYEELLQLELSFIGGIPLKVIEIHFYNNANNLNSYPYIEYEDVDIDNVRAIDMYILLEEFFERIFGLVTIVADLYNLEIKINNKAQISTDWSNE